MILPLKVLLFRLLHWLIIFSGLPFCCVPLQSNTTSTWQPGMGGSHSIKILCRLVAKHLSLCLATETVKCVNIESEDPTLELLALLA